MEGMAIFAGLLIMLTAAVVGLSHMLPLLSHLRLRTSVIVIPDKFSVIRLQTTFAGVVQGVFVSQHTNQAEQSSGSSSTELDLGNDEDLPQPFPTDFFIHDCDHLTSAEVQQCLEARFHPQVRQELFCDVTPTTALTVVTSRQSMRKLPYLECTLNDPAATIRLFGLITLSCFFIGLMVLIVPRCCIRPYLYQYAVESNGIPVSTNTGSATSSETTLIV